MPAKNSVKTYVENSFYHIYNRGVEKRIIYQDKKDYKTYLSYLKIYLSPVDEKEPLHRLQNHSETIDLIAYCLMPNHFHLLVKQHTKYGINSFIQSLNTKFSIYFNKRYNRVGSLFQGRYKAVRIKTDEQLLYLTKYIHQNPLSHSATRSDLVDYPYSSYRNYLGITNQIWIKPKCVLDYYGNQTPHLSYKNFVEENTDISPINNLTIEKAI